MNRFSMFYIARALQRSGYQVINFQYRFLSQSPDEYLPKLREHIVALDEGDIYFVGHSMGGLLAIRYLREWGCENVKALVMLGTPVQGSQTARMMSGSRWGRLMLGRSQNILIAPSPPLHEIPVGVIAGSVALGMTRLFNRLEKPCDGPVALKETKAEWLTDHIVLPHSHTGLLFASDVIDQIRRFFDEHHFSPNNG